MQTDWKRVTQQLAEGEQVYPFLTRKPEGAVVVPLERISLEGRTPKKMRAALWERRSKRTLLRKRCAIWVEGDCLVVGAVTHPDALHAYTMRKVGK